MKPDSVLRTSSRALVTMRAVADASSRFAGRALRWMLPVLALGLAGAAAAPGEAGSPAETNPIGSGQEVNSLRNVNRGDKI